MVAQGAAASPEGDPRDPPRGNRENSIKLSYYTAGGGKGDGSYVVQQTKRGVVVEVHIPFSDCSKLRPNNIRIDGDILEMAFECVDGGSPSRLVVKLPDQIRILRVRVKAGENEWGAHVRIR